MIYIDIVFSMFLAAAISYMLLAALNLFFAKPHCRRHHNIIQNPHGPLFMLPDHHHHHHHHRDHNNFHCRY